MLTLHISTRYKRTETLKGIVGNERKGHTLDLIPEADVLHKFAVAGVGHVVVDGGREDQSIVVIVLPEGRIAGDKIRDLGTVSSANVVSAHAQTQHPERTSTRHTPA